MKNGFFIILLIISLVSCTKNERIIKVSGQIFDPALNSVVSGATIKLKAAKVESGVYNSNYTEIATATTDVSGNYTMDVKVEKVSGYRFIVSHEKYFEIEEDVNTADFEKKNEFAANYELFPKSTIHLTVQNTSPQGMDDEIKYRYTNTEIGCKTCCNNNTITGTGPSYSSDKECDVKGEKWIYINWVVSKAGTQHIYSDSIYMEAFKKSNFNIDY